MEKEGGEQKRGGGDEKGDETRSYTEHHRTKNELLTDRQSDMKKKEKEQLDEK